MGGWCWEPVPSSSFAPGRWSRPRCANVQGERALAADAAPRARAPTRCTWGRCGPAPSSKDRPPRPLRTVGRGPGILARAGPGQRPPRCGALPRPPYAALADRPAPRGGRAGGAPLRRGADGSGGGAGELPPRDAGSPGLEPPLRLRRAVARPRRPRTGAGAAPGPDPHRLGRPGAPLAHPSARDRRVRSARPLGDGEHAGADSHAPRGNAPAGRGGGRRRRSGSCLGRARRERGDGAGAPLGPPRPRAPRAAPGPDCHARPAWSPRAVPRSPTPARCRCTVRPRRPSPGWRWRPARSPRWPGALAAASVRGSRRASLRRALPLLGVGALALVLLGTGVWVRMFRPAAPGAASRSAASPAGPGPGPV